jgi:hypothetical protein
MTNCGLLDISSSSNENVGPNAISIDPIINVGLVIFFLRRQRFLYHHHQFGFSLGGSRLFDKCE